MFYILFCRFSVYKVRYARTTVLCATSDTVLHDSGKYFDNCSSTSAVEKVLEKVGDDAGERLWVAAKLLKALGF